MKDIKRILTVFAAAICLISLAVSSVSAKTAETVYGTDTFFGGFISLGQSKWTLRNGALVNGERGKDGRSVMAFDAEITGAVSFKYEIVYSFSGYGAGMAFKAVDEDSYYGVEINIDQPNGKVYSMKRTPDWSYWQLGHKDLAEAASRYDLVFEYDAGTREAVIKVNGEEYNKATDYDADEIAGKIGLFSEDATVTVIKAELTVDGSKKDLIGAVRLPGNGTGEWTVNSRGLTNFSFGESGRAVAVFDLAIDGTKSFRYEATYTYEGYGCGPTFKSVNEDSYFGLETNVDNYIYSVKRTPDWSIWQLSHTSIEPQTSEYNITFEYDAQNKTAKITLNGNDYNTAEGYDAAEIAGKLGFFTEGNAFCYVTSLKLTVTEELPDDPTRAPAATDKPDDTSGSAETNEPVPSTGDASPKPFVYVLTAGFTLAGILAVGVSKKRV